MEAKDLMIGDIIYLLLDRYEEGFIKEPHKVTGIKTDGDHPVIQTDATDTYYCQEAYEPISITPEILVKNGFKFVPVNSLDKAEQAYASLVQSDGIYVYKRRSKNGFFKELVKLHYDRRHKEWVITWMIGKDAVIDVAPANFIHQLQHAMRLCGITGEIII